MGGHLVLGANAENRDGNIKRRDSLSSSWEEEGWLPPHWLRSRWAWTAGPLLAGGGPNRTRALG
jgi:hypothetical protein